MPISERIKTALRAGGCNLSFGFYVRNMTTDRAEHFADLPKIYAAGARHVRPVTGMNAIEEGTSGKVNVAFWDELMRFIRQAKANGLVTIVDIHTAGDGDWVDGDYMGELRKAAMRTRHINLMRDIATRLQAATDIRDWVIIQPANEPIFTNNEADGQIWYNHQRALIPVIRQAAPDIPVFIMGIDWQGIDETYNWLDEETAGIRDDMTIVDCHFYEPMELSHGDGNERYPGVIDSWRFEDVDGKTDGQELWDKNTLRRLISPLKQWQTEHNIPLVNISEYGTNNNAERESRLRYITDLADLFREFGFGHTIYTWGAQGGDQFDMRPEKRDPRIAQAVFKGVTVPPPDPDPDPDPDPEPTELEERVEALETLTNTLKGENAVLRSDVTELKTQVSALLARLSAASTALGGS